MNSSVPWLPTFQSTHPRGVRPAPGYWPSGARCFNPRTREGCDGVISRDHLMDGVSIHAPARGATPRSTRPRSQSTSFNPRTREGCDFAEENARWWAVLFQSTHPRGVRRDRLVRLRLLVGVSIHAPARGATVRFWDKAATQAQFQSTHPRGVRLICESVVPSMMRFQSTHPRGVRHGPRRISGSCQPVSIHAPARGATDEYEALLVTREGFNPRTREGCDVEECTNRTAN